MSTLEENLKTLKNCESLYYKISDMPLDNDSLFVKGYNPPISMHKTPRFDFLKTVDNIRKMLPLLEFQPLSIYFKVDEFYYSIILEFYNNLQLVISEPYNYKFIFSYDYTLNVYSIVEINKFLKQNKKEYEDDIKKERLQNIKENLFFSNYKLKKMNGFNWMDFRHGDIVVYCKSYSEIYDFKKKLENQDWYGYLGIYDDIWELALKRCNGSPVFSILEGGLYFDELKNFNKDFVYEWKNWEVD